MSDERPSVTVITLTGQQYLRDRRYEDAVKWYGDALRDDSSNASWWSCMGRALECLDRVQEALLCYEEALKIEPANCEFWNDCGVMLNLLDNKSDAEAAFREALKIRPDYANAKQNLADVISRTPRQNSQPEVSSPAGEIFTDHELRELIERVRLNVAASPADVSLVIRLVALLLRVNDTDEALKYLNRLIKFDSQNVEALTLLCDIYSQLQQPRKAVATVRKLLAMHPDDYRLYLKLSDALRDGNHLKDAIEAARVAIELAPDNADCWKTWAEIMEATHDNSYCHALLRAAELARFDSELWYKLGTCVSKKCEFDNAILYFKRAGELAPRVNRYWIALGLIYEKIGQNQQAEEIYNMVIAYDPRAPKAWNNLGVLRIYRGDQDGAEQAFRSAIEFAPDYPNPWYNLRDLMLAKGDKAGAQIAKDRADAVKSFAASWEGDREGQ